MPTLIGIFIFVLLTIPVFPGYSQVREDTVPKYTHEAVCFVYHRFGDSRYPSTNIPAPTFKMQLQYLKENNFNVMSLGDVVQSDSVPEKTVVITIDDGFRSFLENGLPLLQKYQFPATIFINTETVGIGDYLSWAELRTISEAGVEIGNHSHKHEHYLNYPEDKLSEAYEQDIITAQDLFEDNLGLRPVVHAYSYGEFNKKMQNVLKRHGFIAAAAQNSGVIDLHGDLFALPRFPMGGPYATFRGFMTKVHMHALPVIWIKPDKHTFVHNPPILEVCIDGSRIKADHINCFIDDSEDCLVINEETEEGLVVRIRSRYNLSGRRTMYKLTAPLADDSGWCWFSHLWVNTEVQER